MPAWSSILLPVAVTAAWIWIPGLLSAAALRLRPAQAWALAPLVSVAAIALAAIVLPLLGLPWAPVPVATACLLPAAALWVVRLLRRRPAARRPLLTAPGALTALAISIAGALLTGQVIRVLGRPEAISQTFDNVFHQSAVRWILEGNSPSSTAMLAMTAGEDQSQFYPAAWHDIVSLVLETIGSEDVPLATNALAIVVCAMIWPAGIILLTRTVLPSSLMRTGILPAGVLAASVPQFPLFFLDFGVLYPNLLGLALLPGMLLVLLHLVGLARREGMTPAAIVVIGLLGAVALSLSHPNTSMALMALSIPVTAVAAARAAARWRDPRSRVGATPVLLLLVLTATMIVAAVLLWPVIRPPEASMTWDPIMTVPEAIGEAITLGAGLSATPIALSVLLLLGAYAALRRRRPEMLLAWVVAAYLWVAIAAWPEGEDRTALVGIWYNDPLRLPPLLVIPAIPVMALGTAHLVRAIVPRRPLAWLPGSALATALLLVITQPSPWMEEIVSEAGESYALTDSSQLLTADESALIQELPQLLPEDAVIVVSAWNGGSLAYPSTGIETTRHHTLEDVSSEDRIMEKHLRDAAEDPAVCEALDTLGARYVLDFGTDNVNGADWDFPGLEDLGSAEGFTEIAAHGEARLYRIEACGP